MPNRDQDQQTNRPNESQRNERSDLNKKATDKSSTGSNPSSRDAKSGDSRM